MPPEERRLLESRIVAKNAPEPAATEPLMTFWWMMHWQLVHQCHLWVQQWHLVVHLLPLQIGGQHQLVCSS